jgi:hypothetical protein
MKGLTLFGPAKESWFSSIFLSGKFVVNQLLNLSFINPIQTRYEIL